MLYCKNTGKKLSYPKFLPNSTHTIFTILVNQHIVLVMAPNALLKVVRDRFLSLNKRNISALALLDFSSAFHTIDHSILVHSLHTDFGFTDAVLQWFSRYLTDRTHYISLSKHCSALLLYTKLTDSKTELMLVTSKGTRHLHTLCTSITIGKAHIPFKQSVKNLAFSLDSHLTMNAHVSNIARTCYFELRRLASIHRFLTSAATPTIVSAFVLSRIDYCSSLLLGFTHDITSHLHRM